MPPKYPKLLKTAKETGDRRIYKVLHSIFLREKKAYEGDQRSYNERIEEIEARVEYRHGLIFELRKLERDAIIDQGLEDLINEEKEDLAEIGRLVQMKYAASLRAGQKSIGIRKLRKVE